MTFTNKLSVFNDMVTLTPEQEAATGYTSPRAMGEFVLGEMVQNTRDPKGLAEFVLKYMRTAEDSKKFMEGYDRAQEAKAKRLEENPQEVPNLDLSHVVFRLEDSA